MKINNENFFDPFGPPLPPFAPNFGGFYCAASPLKNLGHNAPLPEYTF